MKITRKLKWVDNKYILLNDNKIYYTEHEWCHS